jgi:dihydrofolate reductase
VTKLVLIAAHGRRRELGANNQLLWHLPEDMAHFKALTLGQTVLMGRKTWDSLPPRFRPLPGRRNLVLTRAPHWHGAEVVHSLQDALQRCTAPELWVIGGAEVYALTLPLADRLELTQIDAAYPEADCFFPAYPEPSAPPPWQTAAHGTPGLRYRFLSIPLR